MLTNHCMNGWMNDWTEENEKLNKVSKNPFGFEWRYTAGGQCQAAQLGIIIWRWCECIVDVDVTSNRCNRMNE